MRLIGQAGLAGLTLTLLLVQGGCVTARPEPAALPAELRAQLGKVGVVAARFAPPIDMTRPMTKLRAAGLGFLLGGPFYALVGAGSAEWADRAQKAEAALQHAFGELKTQQTLGDRLVALARDEARLDLVPVGDVGPTDSQQQEIDYRSLAAEGIDTILEVSVTRLGLRDPYSSVWDFPGPNPPLALSMTTRLRLIRSGDGAEFYREELSHRSQSKTFVEWGAHDAQALREVLDATYTTVAREIIRLTLPPPPEPRIRPAPTLPAPEPSLSAVPLNVWKTAPIGEQGATIRYQLIEKGSPLDTCTPPLVSVRIYEGGVQCAPAGLLK
jgi:hypothetical protein